MGHRIRKLHITVGLPASGKTTWSMNERKNNYRIARLECDLYIGEDNTYANMTELLESNEIDKLKGEVIFDGLFLTESDIEKVVWALMKKKIHITEVVIQYWVPNRDTCLWNDSYRRALNSSITIENAVIDDFNDVSKLKTKFPLTDFSVVKHSVVKVEGYKLFANKYNLYIDEYGVCTGSSWCTGGTWADCWGNDGTVGGDAQPEGMSELDDLLEEVAPTITFLQYKKILNDCVSVQEFSEGDYYGGTTYHNRYELDVERLYNYLIEKEFIKTI